MPAIRRTLKNVVKNYSDAQVKVREATSNDPWGPSSTLMSEIADLTYNVVAFTEIMQMVWKRLNDDGKNWRHVYKSLVLLDYIVKTGSEKVAQQCRENFHAIKTLTSFQHVDADNKDQGMNVREKAKQLVAILSEDDRLKNERAKALKAKERFAQNAMGVGTDHGSSRPQMQQGGSPPAGAGYQASCGYQDSSHSSGSAGSPSEIESARPSSAGEEELQLELALAMSREEHEEAVRKQKSDDIKLQMAIEQSKEQAKHQSTLLDLASTSTSRSQGAAINPWVMPLQSSQPTDPWGSPLPGPRQSDPWGSSHAATGARHTAYSPVRGSPANVICQPADPWGLPASSPSTSPLHSTDAWSESSPTPQASGWCGSSPTPQTSLWGGSSSTSQAAGWGGPSPITQASGWGGPSPTRRQPGSAMRDFDAPKAHVTNGTGTNMDSQFDLLGARSTDASPTKAHRGMEEFDQLSGDSQANGSSDDAFNLDELKQNIPQQNKKKSAETFLGGHTNLVNLEQLVSNVPPKGQAFPKIS